MAASSIEQANTSPFRAGLRDLELLAVLRVAHHRANVGKQLLRVVNDAVLDGVLDSTDSNGLVGLADLERSGSIEHLEVRQGILIHDDEVGELADLNRPDLVVHAEELRSFQRGGANHLQRVESGLSQKLQLADLAKTVKIVDEIRVRAGGDPTTHVLVGIDVLHPNLVAPPQQKTDNCFSSITFRRRRKSRRSAHDPLQAKKNDAS